MSVIEVQGLTPLEGEIKIQGSKNAVLPMMAAAILHKGTTVIENVPRIQDVFCMLGILDSIGCKCRLEGNRPVSYTHLDVYKRQAHRRAGSACESGRKYPEVL